MMRNSVDIFLGDLKCQLQRFEPKPGDVFVVTFPGDMSEKLAQRFRSGWNKIFPHNQCVIVVSGGTTISLRKRAKRKRLAA